MRIGVYLASLNASYVGGLTTYAIGLMNGLIANSRGNSIVAFVSDEGRHLLAERLTPSPLFTTSIVSEPRPGPFERLTGLPGLEVLHASVRNGRMREVSRRVAAECDIVLFPLCFMATYDPGVPSIVSFHDLQHEVFPQFFSWSALRARRVLFGSTFRHATIVQASSQAMMQEALRFYGDRITPSRIAVIPEGVEFDVFAGPRAEDARRTYALPEQFLHYPAQLWRHKNHLRLLEALDLIKCRDNLRIPLVLNGAEYEAAPNVRDFIAQRALTDQVFMLGKVPFADLLSLYRQASYVVSASLHESNCLPMLEAAASGTPIIAADIACNRESAKVFQLRLFDPLDIRSIADTLIEAWTNRRANEAGIAANREAARQFDWSVIAGLYLDEAQKILNTPRTLSAGMS
jgi:glycosyltransferase involved in cell wall biosynthesis